ncbi:hypothetical protein HN588_16930 [Candidatus Bathyarchaeota archaeon]|nr:hypothetical protein [Candidatus Bathyarchaeota archaeon]
MGDVTSPETAQGISYDSIGSIAGIGHLDYNTFDFSAIVINPANWSVNLKHCS